MSFEARRQFGRDVGRYSADYTLDPCRVPPPAEMYYQTPPSLGFSRVPPCGLAPPESNFQRNPQARGLYDEMLKVGERKLNVNTQRPSNRFVDCSRMDDFIEDDSPAGAEVQSQLHHETNLCFSPRAKGRMGSTPIHRWDSSPTSVLDGSGDPWNFLHDTSGGRLNPMDFHNPCDLHNHFMDRSSYLVARQMGSPRSPPYNNSPFATNMNAYSQGGLPNPCGTDSEMANWPQNGHGMMSPMQARHQASKLAPPSLMQQDRGFQPHSNPRTPMRAVFVTERNSRESSGTGVFLPRCVGGGPDFNRKPVCSPVLLPIWNDGVPSSPSRKPLDNSNPRKTAGTHCHSFSQPSPAVGLSQHCTNNASNNRVDNNLSSRHHHCSSNSGPSSEASNHGQKCNESSSLQAEEHNLEDLDLPPEWVY